MTSEEQRETHKLSEEESKRFARLRAWEKHERIVASFILDNAKAVKNRKGLTAAQLAERLSKAGWPLSVSSLNGMLGKKKRATITITEIFALGAALEVPPIELLFPDSSDAYAEYRGVHIQPAFFTSPEFATDWFTGNSTQDNSDRLVRAALLEMTEQLRGMQEKVRELQEIRRKGRDLSTEKQADDG